MTPKSFIIDCQFLDVEPEPIPVMAMAEDMFNAIQFQEAVWREYFTNAINAGLSLTEATALANREVMR